MFTVGTPTSVDQAWTYSETPGNCTYSCTGGYSGSDCSIPPACELPDDDAYCCNGLGSSGPDKICKRVNCVETVIQDCGDYGSGEFCYNAWIGPACDVSY